MLIDFHAHSSGISICCKKDYKAIIETAKEYGIDGFILTNHYQKEYAEERPNGQLIRDYIDEYKMAKEYGDKNNFRVFFGVEVTMTLYPCVHFLVYGVDTDFLYKHPDIYGYTQEELYKAVKENGGILVQAHPFRNNATVLDTSLMDGIEISCHPIYKVSCSERLIPIAKENNLIVTCGGDYHADSYRPRCGVYIPDDIKDEKALCRYITTAKNTMLCIQEPYCDEVTDVFFTNLRKFRK